MSYVYDPYLWSGISGFAGTAASYGYSRFMGMYKGNVPVKSYPMSYIGPHPNPFNNIKPVGAQDLDHIPSGVSTKVVHVYCRPTIKQWHKPKSMSFYQYSQVLDHTSSGAPGQAGNQILNVLATLLTTADFCRSSHIAASSGGLGKNLFALNPNQATTGAGFPLATVGGYRVSSDMITTSANPVTPGANFIKTINPSIPIQDYVNVHTIDVIIELTNLANAVCYGDIYVCKAERDTQGISAVSSWIYSQDQFDETETETALPTANTTTLFSPSRNLVNNYPRTSTVFRNNWKVLKCIPCQMAQGASCKLKIKMHVNREYSREAMSRKNDDNLAYPKGMFQIFSSFHGQPTRNSDGVAPLCVYSDVSIANITTVKVHLSYPNRNPRLSAQYAWTDQANLTDVKQKLTSTTGTQTNFAAA